MTEPTPAPTYTDAQRLEAAVKLEEVRQQMRAPDAPPPETPRANALVEKFHHWNRIAVSEPAPPPKSAAVLTSWRDERAAAKDLDEARAEMLAAAPGSERHAQALGIIQELTREKLARTAPPAPAHELIATVPKSIERESWLPEALSAAEPLGLGYDLGPWLHVVESARQSPGRFTYETGVAELVRRHGEERANEIIDEAREMETHLTKPVRQYLTAHGLLNHPDVIEHGAGLKSRIKR